TTIGDGSVVPSLAVWLPPLTSASAAAGPAAMSNVALVAAVSVPDVAVRVYPEAALSSETPLKVATPATACTACGLLNVAPPRPPPTATFPIDATAAPPAPCASCATTPIAIAAPATALDGAVVYTSCVATTAAVAPTVSVLGVSPALVAVMDCAPAIVASV